MKRILFAGCGDIALRVAPLLGNRGRLFGLVRNPARCEALRQAGITPVPGDLDNRSSLARLAGLADILLHFAPPPDEGLADSRTRNLLAALSHGAPPGQFIYISTSGVYGDCGGAHIDETRPPNAQSLRAQRRMDAEGRIRAWAARHGVHAGILRVPGIYAADRLPFDRLRSGAVAIAPEQDSYTNHIHAEDLAHAIIAALHHAKPNRIYHISDDSGMKMGDYLDAVADACNLPRPQRLPRAEAERAVSPMLWSFMKESRRLLNERMKRELGVKLLYPTVQEFIARDLRQAL